MNTAEKTIMLDIKLLRNHPLNEGIYRGGAEVEQDEMVQRTDADLEARRVGGTDADSEKSFLEND